MHALADGLPDRLEHKRVVLGVVRLQEADVVGGIDLAVSGHFRAKVFTVLVGDSTEEVVQDVFVLALHVHVVQLGDDDRLIETHLSRQESATALQN